MERAFKARLAGVVLAAAAVATLTTATSTWAQFGSTGVRMALGGPAVLSDPAGYVCSTLGSVRTEGAGLYARGDTVCSGQAVHTTIAVKLVRIVGVERVHVGSRTCGGSACELYLPNAPAGVYEAHVTGTWRLRHPGSTVWLASDPVSCSLPLADTMSCVARPWELHL